MTKKKKRNVTVGRLLTVLCVVIAGGFVGLDAEGWAAGRREAAAREASPAEAHWWDGRVFYEVFIRSSTCGPTSPPESTARRGATGGTSTRGTVAGSTADSATRWSI
jgi:hypothetical protein